MTTRRFPIPCLVCGNLTRNGSYCDAHPKPETPHRQQRKRQLYNSDYKRQAKHIRQTSTHCWICGQETRGEADPIEADHLIPGQPHSPLAPAHRSCNQWRGNRTIEQTLKDHPHRPDRGGHTPRSGLNH